MASSISDLLLDLYYPVAVLLFALGLSLCFFGYRHLRSLLGIVAFLLGMGVAWGVMLQFFARPLPWHVVLIAFALGAASGLALLGSYYVSVVLAGFQVGAVPGILLAYGLCLLAAIDPPALYYALGAGGILTGIAGALLAMKIRRGLLVVFTALDGAVFMTAGIVMIVGGIAISPATLIAHPLLLLDVAGFAPAAGLLVLTMGLLGWLFQSRSARIDRADRQRKVDS